MLHTTATDNPPAPWRRVRWQVAGSLAVAITFSAGCTENGGREHPTRSVPAAEERLDFVWNELIEVPASQRPPVDVAREWMYGWYLWNTGLEDLPAPLTENSADRSVYPRDGTTPLVRSGTVVVTLVELEIYDSETVVAVCSDTTKHTYLEADPPETEGGILGRWLTLVRNGTGPWLVADREADDELSRLCDEV